MREEAPRPSFRITLQLFLLGLVTLLGQVVLLRELLVQSFGSELVVLLSLGLLLLGSAAGAAWGRWMDRPAEDQICRLFLLFALVLPSAWVLARFLRLLFAAIPGTLLTPPQQLMGMALVLLPAGVLGGALFQRCAALAVQEGGSLARAYAAESLGGLAGGLLATLLAFLRAPAAGLALAAALFAAAGGWPEGWRIRRWSAAASAGLCVAAALALLGAAPLDLALTRCPEPAVELQVESPYGRIAVSKRLEQTAVFLSGALAGESQSTAAEEFVHPAALCVEEPRRILLLGGSVEGMAQEILKHGPERVEAVEIDSSLLELARNLDPPEVRAAEAAGRLVRVAADPRRRLKSAGAFDLILSAMPEPGSGQANRFYTREFFAACRKHLRPGGVLALRLRSAENLWTPALELRNASVAAALREAFPHTLFLPGTATVVLASAQALAEDPEVLVRRWHARGVQARLATPSYLRYLFTNDRVAQIRRRLDRARVPANSDARPVSYPCTMLLWLSRFFPSLGFAAPFRPTALAGWTAGAFLIPLLLLGLLRRGRWRALPLAAVAGFAGMVLEGAVLLRFQSSSGALYGELGLLLALFMGGLAAGAWYRSGLREEISRRAGLLLSAGLVLLCLVIAFWCFSRHPLGLVGAGALLAAAGTLTGGLFAHAGQIWGKDRGEGPAFLYAADLAGGCWGAVAGSLLLLPFLGLGATCLLLGALALLLVWREK
jgi:spermidine synthase